jgi:hypothetical protein
LTRKLIALDLLLLVVGALLTVEVRREWLAAKGREKAFLEKKMKPTPPQPLAPLTKPSTLAAVTYALVAEKNLFSKDRNSNVILDPVIPPPPKPVPPFPLARGVMLWDGVPPTVVLTEKAGGAQKGYHPGDTVGEWQLISVDNQYVVLEWEGKQFKKRLDELLDKTALMTAEAPAQQAAPSAPAALTPVAQPLSTSTPDGLGADMGGGFRACVAGDTAPAGTVMNGMKKVVSASPFGTICRWESAK